MVDHDHDRIKPRRRREISDEVHGQLLKGESDLGPDGKERRDSQVCVGLILLTDGATSNEVLYEGGKAQPPEILFQDGLGMKDPHMTQERGGVDGVE